MLDGLDEIAWLNLHDAYGPADTVADAIRALLSGDAEIRDQARWSLSSTIYHQGDIFDSTAVALPFLVDIFIDAESPDRNELGQFIDAIAQSAEVGDNQIREHWKRQYERWAHLFDVTETEKAESHISDIHRLRAALLAQTQKMAPLLSNPPADLSEI